MNVSKVIAREWITFLIAFFFGLLALVPVLCLIFSGDIAIAYRQIFSFGDEYFWRSWMIVFLPYVVCQIFRSIKWAIKTAKAP